MIKSKILDGAEINVILRMSIMSYGSAGPVTENARSPPAWSSLFSATLDGRVYVYVCIWLGLGLALGLRLGFAMICSGHGHL